MIGITLGKKKKEAFIYLKETLYLEIYSISLAFQMSAIKCYEDPLGSLCHPATYFPA